jgi:hypothetical protein
MSGDQGPNYPYGAANTGYPPVPPGVLVASTPGPGPGQASQPQTVRRQRAQSLRPDAPYQVGSLLPSCL